MHFLERIRDLLGQMPSKALLNEIHNTGGLPTTATTLRSQINRMRSGLESQGVRLGSRVLLLAAHNSNWVAADLAILASGAIAVPLDPDLDVEHCKAIIHDCDPTLVIDDDPIRQTALKAAYPALTICELNQLSHHKSSQQPWNLPASDAIVTLIYPGTQDTPLRGVALTADNINSVLPALRDTLGCIMQSPAVTHRILHALPMHTIGGQLLLWTSLMQGSALFIAMQHPNDPDVRADFAAHYYLLDSAGLEALHRTILTELNELGRWGKRLTHAMRKAQQRIEINNPRPYDQVLLRQGQRLLKPHMLRHLGSQLRFVFCHNAAQGTLAAQRGLQVLGVPVYQAYGSAESSGLTTLDTVDQQRVGCVGRAIPGCNIRLSADGEMLLQGANIAAGYWNQPALSESILDQGWLRSGQRAEIDVHGRWRLLHEERDANHTDGL